MLASGCHLSTLSAPQPRSLRRPVLMLMSLPTLPHGEPFAGSSGMRWEDHQAVPATSAAAASRSHPARYHLHITRPTQGPPSVQRCSPCVHHTRSTCPRTHSPQPHPHNTPRQATGPPAQADGLPCAQLTAFFDYGTDWRSAEQVLGAPAQVRGKPGQGWGTGVGVKARTPLGPLRLEYAVNDRHQRPGWRLNVGSMGML